MKNLVWLASYPRSGNTWFRAFLSYLLTGNQCKDLNHLRINLLASSRVMFDEMAGINASDLLIPEQRNLRPTVFKLLSDQSGELLFLKSHDRFYITRSGTPVFPPDRTFGCIYIVRNPLDVAVSNACYFNKSIDEVILSMNNPLYALHSSPNRIFPVLEEWLGTWSDHVISWVTSEIRVHVVRYEDMIGLPVETFMDAVRFLDLKFTEEDVRHAISGTSFETLQRAETQFGFKERLQSCKAFFRNGKAGNWENILTESQIKKITTDHEVVMARFGYI